MDTTSEDIAYLNSELLLLVSDPDQGKQILRLLGADHDVVSRIAQAGPAGIRTAIDCQIPLVTFVPKFDELIQSSRNVAPSSAAKEIPIELRELTRKVLRVTQRLALLDSMIMQLYFGFGGRLCQSFVNVSVTQLERLSDRHGVLLRLRSPSGPQGALFWDRVFMGDRWGARCNDARGFRLSQFSAMLSCDRA